MKRIDRLAVRIAALMAKQDTEQNWPRFILHLSDGSTAELVARLPEALVKLAELGVRCFPSTSPNRRTVWQTQIMSYIKPLRWAAVLYLMQEPPFYGKMIHTYCRQRNPQRMKQHLNEITI